LLKTPGTSIAQPGGGSSLPGTSLPDPADPPSLGTPEQQAANLRSKKDQNFEHTFATRQQIGLFPTEGLTGYLSYVYQRTKTNGNQSNSAGVLGTGRYENASRYLDESDRKAHLVSFELEAELGDVAQLVSATAYTKRQTKSHSDVTDLLLDLDYDYELFPAFSGFTTSQNTQRQWNQEIRLVSAHGGSFSWVLGGFFNELKTQNDYAERTPGLAQDFGITDNPESLEYVSYTKSRISEKAVFGEASFQVTPEWQVTAGGRYFKYKSDIEGAIVLPLLGDPLSPYDVEPGGGVASDDGVVWKFNTSYKFSPNLMVYVTYSKGYRIGGPNRVAPCPENLEEAQNACALPNELFFGPDKTINKEIGIRGSLFDRKLNFSLSGYHIDWKGIQLGSVTTFGATGITVNGGEAVSKGIDFSFDARPIPKLTISGTYAYNDAHLTEDVEDLLTYRNSAFPGLRTNGRPCSVFWGSSNPLNATCEDKFVDVDAKKGDRLPGSTKNSGTISLTWEEPIGDATILANWTAIYRGGVFSRPGNRAFGERIPSYIVNRASVTYQMEDWEVRLFADNIFDKYAITSVGNDRSRQIVNDGIASRYYTRGVISPRKLGVETVFRF
ncbi:MAG: TonB-dependent receptor, partial [Sphingobium sp.]